MGPYMVLVTFASKERLDEVLLHEKEWLSSFFFKVRPWSVSKWSHSRRAWLECCSLPPYTWFFSNLCKIGDLRGTWLTL